MICLLPPLLGFSAIILLAGLASGDEGASVVVHVLNQAEYGVNTDADRDSTVPKEIFENWLDLDLRFDNVLVGFRHEVFQPHEQAPDSVREGIVQRYAELDFGPGAIRVGNFYEIFGRGLLFRSYEERSIRIDGNLDGVLFWGGLGPLRGKAFSGRIRNIESDERRDVLRGADLEGKLGMGLSVGGSYLIQSSKNPNPKGYFVPPEPRHEEVVGGRVSWTHDYFDAYAEAGRINRLYLTSLDRILGRGYDDLRGTGYYAALSTYPIPNLSFSVEYKEYNRFRFTPVSSSGTDYNNPPALSRETSYALISRHPHQLDPNDEKGFQVEAVMTPIEGATITLNRSETARVDRDLFRHKGLFFHEWYAEWRQDVGDNWVVAGAYDYIDDAESGTRNHTPVLDVEYISGEQWGLRSEYQFQQSESPLGITRNHFSLLEYTVSYDLIVSLVGEHATFLDPGLDETGEVTAKERKEDFFYAELDYRITQEHYLTIMVGGRRAGFICVGGVCRFEPEFEGVEIKLNTSF